MSRTLKDKVRTQVKIKKRQKEDSERIAELRENCIALSAVERAMQSKLDALEEIDEIPNENEVYAISTQRLERLGFRLSYGFFRVPLYQGGKYTPAQLLARTYKSKLDKARKVRAQEVREACKQVVKKLEEGQFSIRGQFTEVFRVEVDGNCGQYKYDKMVAEEFFDRRKLSLLDVRDGYIFFNLPD